MNVSFAHNIAKVETLSTDVLVTSVGLNHTASGARDELRAEMTTCPIAHARTR